MSAQERDDMLTRLAATGMALRWGKMRKLIEDALLSAAKGENAGIMCPSQEEAERVIDFAQRFYPGMGTFERDGDQLVTVSVSLESEVTE